MKRDFLRLFALTQSPSTLHPLRKLVMRKLEQWNVGGGQPFAPMSEADPKDITCAVGHVVRFVEAVRHPNEFTPPNEIYETDPPAKVQRIQSERDAYEKSVEIAARQVTLIQDLAATINAVPAHLQFAPEPEPVAVKEPIQSPDVDPATERSQEPIQSPNVGSVAEPTLEPEVPQAPVSKSAPVKPPRKRKSRKKTSE